jgi:Uma2 family endonuclease
MSIREFLKSDSPPKGKISFEEFLDWMDEDTHAEWVDGEIAMTSPASYEHQNIVRFLSGILSIYNDMFDLGEFIPAPFQMKLSKNSREPDIIFISKANLANLQKTFYLGAADLVVEIVSPESQTRDRQNKFSEYEEDGAKEYWLIDPTQNQAIFYQLNTNSKFEEVKLDNEGKYHSKILAGFWVDPSWFWQLRLPSINSVMFKINRQAYPKYLATL